MQKIIYFITALFAIVGFAQAQKPKFPQHMHAQRGSNPAAESRVASHGETPNLAIHFIRDLQLSQWDSTGRYTYSYFPNGDLAEEVRESYGSTFVPASRTVYAYTVPGYYSSYTTYYWDGSAWVGDYQSQYTYDAQNNPLTYWFLTWNVSQWDTTAGSKYSRTYVYTNRVASEIGLSWNSQTHLWDTDWREVYHWYSAQGWDSLTSYDWDGSAWQPQERYVDVSWHDIDEDEPFGARTQSYNGAIWEDFDRFAVTYTGPTDNYVAISEEWTGSSWDSVFKDIIVHDSHDHEISYMGYEYWSGAWHLYGSQITAYSYDAQGSTTQIIYDDLDSAGILQNSYKIEYPSFFTNAPEPTSLGANVTAYPNPCSDRLNFQVKLKQNGPAHIALYDLQGRLRMQTVTPARVGEDIALPISEVLENGTYIYRIQTKEGEASSKITLLR